MRAERVVLGQRVTEAKALRARELRRHMTAEERVLWQHVRRNALNGLHFRRQQVIDGFIVDFYCHARGLVVELDGGVHDAQSDADVERDQVLAARGLRVLRVTNDEVRNNLRGVMARIASWAAEGGGSSSQDVGASDAVEETA